MNGIEPAAPGSSGRSSQRNPVLDAPMQGRNPAAEIPIRGLNQARPRHQSGQSGWIGELGPRVPETAIGMLPEQLGDDVAADVGQPGIAPAEPEGQLGVVDPQQVQDRGLNVVYVNGVLHG